MKKCMNCGTENQENRKWCKKCMKELPESSMLAAEEYLTEPPKCETRTSRLNGSMGKKIYRESDDLPAGESTQDIHSGFGSDNHHGTEETPVPAEDPTSGSGHARKDSKTVDPKLTGSVGGKRYGGKGSGDLESTPPTSQGEKPGWGKPGISDSSKEDFRGYSSEQKKTSRKTVGIIAACAVAVLLLTVGGYFGWNALMSVFENDIQQPGFAVSNSVTDKTEAKPSKEEQALMEQFDVENIVTYQEDGSLYLKTEVTMPDLSQYFLDVYSEVENTTENVDAFQTNLFERALEESEKSDNTINVELTLNLTDEYPGRTEWTQEELTQLALQAALNAEIEEFAMNIMQNLAPELEGE